MPSFLTTTRPASSRTTAGGKEGGDEEEEEQEPQEQEQRLVFKELRLDATPAKSRCEVLDLAEVQRRHGLGPEGIVALFALLGNEYDGSAAEGETEGAPDEVDDEEVRFVGDSGEDEDDDEEEDDEAGAGTKTKEGRNKKATKGAKDKTKTKTKTKKPSKRAAVAAGSGRGAFQVSALHQTGFLLIIELPIITSSSVRRSLAHSLVCLRMVPCAPKVGPKTALPAARALVALMKAMPPEELKQRSLFKTGRIIDSKCQKRKRRREERRRKKRKEERANGVDQGDEEEDWQQRQKYEQQKEDKWKKKEHDRLTQSSLTFGLLDLLLALVDDGATRDANDDEEDSVGSLGGRRGSGEYDDDGLPHLTIASLESVLVGGGRGGRGGGGAAARVDTRSDALSPLRQWIVVGVVSVFRVRLQLLSGRERRLRWRRD